ncbi:protein phosphatase inhibitor 2-like isoform X2 [Styela clava]|uniref:protein phosphatase inhibitor 2-like isoform X2 n=1 Tax=Styela clava TaxID=7725 RepID=UPI00193AB778|nr:protein phosphatase inhibitor 2-like isoform X2 [Styela clava]
MATTSKSDGTPVRGILKTSKSNHDQIDLKSKDAARFDEMNILATYHPPDKDYGHMKIDEPKTPYRHDRDDVEPEAVDPDELARRLASSEESHHHHHRARTVSSGDEDEDKFMSPQAKQKKDKFEAARKKHYNMKEEMKKARELLAKEMAEDDDD